MPIHGHTKIELTSQTTGEVETIEKDNIVTNAVSQIFNAFNGMALLREANANGEYGSTSDKSLGAAGKPLRRHFTVRHRPGQRPGHPVRPAGGQPRGQRRAQGA